MRIPSDGIIEDAKLVDYLLRPRSEDDKSKYLARGGFTRTNPHELELAIRDATAACDAVEDHRNSFGVFYRIETTLQGVNAVNLPVRIIWLRRVDDRYSLVTVVPAPE